MTDENGFDKCAECHMLVMHNEYHPYAACVLYKQLGQADKVRSCLNNVIEYATCPQIKDGGAWDVISRKGLIERIERQIRLWNNDTVTMACADMLAEIKTLSTTAPTETSARCVKCGCTNGVDASGWCLSGRPYIANQPDSNQRSICPCKCVFPASTEVAEQWTPAKPPIRRIKVDAAPAPPVAQPASLLRDPVTIHVPPQSKTEPDLVVTRDGVPCPDQKAALEEFKAACRASTTPPATAAVEAAREIGEWLRTGDGEVDGNAIKEVAAIISKHFDRDHYE